MWVSKFGIGLPRIRRRVLRMCEPPISASLFVKRFICPRLQHILSACVHQIQWIMQEKTALTRTCRNRRARKKRHQDEVDPENPAYACVEAFLSKTRAGYRGIGMRSRKEMGYWGWRWYFDIYGTSSQSHAFLKFQDMLVLPLGLRKEHSLHVSLTLVAPQVGIEKDGTTQDVSLRQWAVVRILNKFKFPAFRWQDGFIYTFFTYFQMQI